MFTALVMTAKRLLRVLNTQRVLQFVIRKSREEKRNLFSFHSLLGFPVLFYGGHAAGRRPPASVQNDRRLLVHVRNSRLKR